MARQRIGRLRERVAEIVSKALGCPVHPGEDVYPVTGFWKKVDVYRWEVIPRIPNFGMLGCWDTMAVFVKECGKEGVCHISDGEIWPGPESNKE